MPQQYCPDESVVIKAGFSLYPAEITRTYFKAKYEPSPANKDPRTDSARLSAQIKDFLKRSDHLEKKWEKVGGKKVKANGDNLSISTRSSQLSLSCKSGSTLDDLDSFSEGQQRSKTNSLTEFSSVDISENVRKWLALVFFVGFLRLMLYQFSNFEHNRTRNKKVIIL